VTQLPEVEVIRKDLEKDIVGKRIKDVSVKTAALVGRHRNRPEFVKALQGRKIDAITRRGIHLLFELDEGLVLVVRLGSQAAISRETASEEGGKHTQVIATFTTGGALHYVDPVKDGELFVVPAEELPGLEELSPKGIDPLAETFTWPAFSEQLKARKAPLKTVLGDESFIVGLGELYSDEILWAAGLSGRRLSHTLSSQEVRRLYRAVLEVLYEAVKQRGAGEGDPGDLDPFADADDQEYGEHIRVYGKEGDPCGRCRQPIVRGKIDKLESYYCAQCQT
jgi:formamidopyrimidine-DNA glycosylase